ncbi:GNAT family N-acetyltransferase [Geobacillus sp. 44B]|nr:GNAT family N-acetyltransferase [Geobacillus sp. 44B]
MIIREAALSDAEGIAKVHVDCWRTTYKNIISDDFLNKLSYEQRTKLWVQNISREDNYVYVAENEEGQIIGFTDGGKEKSGKYPGYDGDVTSIYILKEYQGLGIGRKLLRQLFKKFISLNIHSSIVWVLKDNNSRFFYERLGAKIVVDNEFIKIGNDNLKLIAYGWESIDKV